MGDLNPRIADFLTGLEFLQSSASRFIRDNGSKLQTIFSDHSPINAKPSMFLGGRDRNVFSGSKKLDLSGTWIKDKRKSSSMEDAIKLMQLGGVMRTAVRLVKGMDIQHTEDKFEIALFSAVPGFKVRERYPLDGTAVKCRRRDFRRGGHRGSASEKKGKVVLEMQWDPPHGGTGTDEFYLASEGVLHVDSTVRATGGGTAAYQSVYQRKR